MSKLDEPIVEALGLPKQGYRLGMAIACAAGAVALLFVPFGWVGSAVLACIAAAKVHNYLTSHEPDGATYK